MLPAPAAMNVRRMVWIGVVWLGCAVAWMVLGTSLVVRSADVSSGALLGAVHSSWGPPLDQRPPTAFYRQTESARETTVTRDKLGGEVETTRMSEKEVPVAVPLGGSDVSAGLELDYRRKGLVWFSTYRRRLRGPLRLHQPQRQPAPAGGLLPAPERERDLRRVPGLRCGGGGDSLSARPRKGLLGGGARPPRHAHRPGAVPHPRNVELDLPPR